MSDFSDILRRGRKKFTIKDQKGEFGRCEECNARALLYKYVDKEKQTWTLCEKCIETFTKEFE